MLQIHRLTVRKTCDTSETILHDSFGVLLLLLNDQAYTSLITLLKRIMDHRLDISIRWDRLGEKIDRVATPPFWWQKNQERIKDQFPMLAFGCTWGPVEVRGQKSFVAFAKKQRRSLDQDHDCA